MTVTEPISPDRAQSSLGTAAARNLATTTKSEPQMQGITPRWLLRVLPWVEVQAGTYRVNRRLSYAVGDGRVTFTSVGADVRVIPQELRELPALRDFADDAALEALAGRFEQREYAAGDVLVEAGRPVDALFLIAHGKVNRIGRGKYGGQHVLDVLADGAYFGDQLLSGGAEWEYTVKAVTPLTVLVLPEGPVLDRVRDRLADDPTADRARNAAGEAAIELASGHEGEHPLPATFVDYELTPREYELSVAQTVLRVHSRVGDLYNQPMDQTEQQLRLTIQALRERQEYELVNNRAFGLLHNADLQQRIHTRTGPPTPDDLDELLSMVWKEPGYFVAHPRAIAAFGRECSRRGVHPGTVEVDGRQLPSWRGVPLLPCDKIGVTATNTSSIMLLRVGESRQGVVALRQTGLPDEYEPGLSVRFMGVDDKAIVSYLVSTYYSAAVLVPDALAVLEHVELGVAE